MKTRTPMFLVATTAALIAASPASSQKPPQFGASAELVLIDLIATGRDGRLVADLRADEIQVFEQGQPQRLEFLRLVAAAETIPRPAANLESPSTKAPPAMGNVQPPDAPTLIVIVDVYTTPADALTLTRKAIIAMAREEVQPGTRMMLVALDRGLQIRQPFTSDLEAFGAAVEALKPAAGNAEATLAGLVEEVGRSCDGVTPGGKENALVQARVYLQNSKQATAIALEGLAAVNRYLAAVPGRKHVVFYSAGYAMQPAAVVSEIVDAACGGGGTSSAYTSLGGAQVDTTQKLRAVLDEANRAQVSLYTVDARGLGGPGAEAIPSAASAVTTRMVSQGFLQRVQSRAQSAPQEILRTLASDTGGVATLNSNDLGRGVRAATADARGYYLLAYTPPADRKRGRFYEIEVKTTRPGLSLRYRKGYEWLSDEDRAERALAHAILFPELHAADGFAVETRIEAGSLKIVTRLPTRSLTFQEEGGRFRNDIELQGVLRDDKGKTVGKRFFFARNVAMNLSFDRRDEILEDENFEIVSDTEPPKKGRYQLTVVARHSGGRLASASTEVEVP